MREGNEANDTRAQAREGEERRGKAREGQEGVRGSWLCQHAVGGVLPGSDCEVV